MDLSLVEERYKDYKPKNIQNPVKVAVLILLAREDGITYVIFEKRSKIVSQPGDISFVGGHVEKDESPIQAAIREATEELKISEKNIRIISEADYFITLNNRLINSFVAELVGVKTDDIVPNDEVERLIKIPLDKLLHTEKKIYKSEYKKEKGEDFPYQLIQGQGNYKFAKMAEDTYFYTVEGVTVWGFTAKVLSSFLENLK